MRPRVRASLGPGDWALLWLAVALYLTLGILSMRGDSATFDEGAHLPAGYADLVTGDHRLNPEQPPLAKLLAAAPLVLLRPTLNLDDAAWQEARQWGFGRAFLYRWNAPDRLLFWGRLSVLVLGALLVAAVGLWTHGHHGPIAGRAALLLATFSPDVLAHGRLVTTDVPVTLFMFLAVVAFDALARLATWARLLGLGLTVGAVLATKFSGPVILPILLVLGLMRARDRADMVSRLSGRELQLRGFRRRVRHVLVLVASAAVIGGTVVWACYRFDGRLSRNPEVRERLLSTTLAETEGGGVARAILAGERLRLVPEAWARGFLFAWRHAKTRSTFLLGRVSHNGFPLFYLVSFVVKTPLPLIAILAWIAFEVLRSRSPGAAGRWWGGGAAVWVPVILLVALTLLRGLQIGHRHILPLYPFLFVAGGAAVARAWAKGRTARWVLALLLAWYVAGTLRVHPHYLAYFNEACGGPANGWRVLVDSSLDWGQDLRRLGSWLRSRGVGPVKLSYFGSADPAAYGISGEDLPGYRSPHPPRLTREVVPGDIVVVSVTNLQGVYLEPEDQPLMERLRSGRPIGVVGYTIRIYRSDFSWSGDGPAEGGTARPAPGAAP